MNSILKARAEISNKLSKLRSIDRLLNSEKFDIIYSYANDIDEQIISTAIKNNDLDSLITWMRNKSKSIDHNEVKIKELHEIAKKLGIVNYSRLPKFILISEINQHKGTTN